MVSAIPTAQGDFRLLTGLWEKAAHHTEAVLHAFERLPGDDQKHTALKRAYALLRISDVICERSNLAANAMGASNHRKPRRRADRKGAVWGKSVSIRVDRGCHRTMKKQR